MGKEQYLQFPVKLPELGNVSLRSENPGAHFPAVLLTQVAPSSVKGLSKKKSVSHSQFPSKFTDDLAYSQN